MKPSIRELLIKAAESINGPVDNLRLDIKDKIGDFFVAHGRSPGAIHLTRRQLKELEQYSDISIVGDGSVMMFGIPMLESKKFSVS